MIKKNKKSDMKNFEVFFEKKKLPQGLQDYLDKKKGNKPDKEDKKGKKEDPTKKWLGKVKDDAKKEEEKNETSSFGDFFKVNEKWNNTIDDEKNMMDSIHNMYGNYIDENNIEKHEVLSFVYNLIKDTPELLDNFMEKN